MFTCFCDVKIVIMKLNCRLSTGALPDMADWKLEPEIETIYQWRLIRRWIWRRPGALLVIVDRCRSLRRAGSATFCRNEQRERREPCVDVKVFPSVQERRQPAAVFNIYAIPERWRHFRTPSGNCESDRAPPRYPWRKALPVPNMVDVGAL